MLACFALLSLADSARATVAPDLLGEEIPTWSVEKIFTPEQQAEEDGRHAIRRRYVTVNLDPLREMAKTGEPMVINLNMFQDDQATLTMEHQQDESSGIHSWIGGNTTTGVRARLRFMQRSGSLSGSSASEDDFSDGWIRGSVHLGLNHQVYFLRAIQSVPGMIAVDHWDPAGVIPTDHGPHGGAEPREPPVDYIPDENEGFAGNSEITRLILYSDSALQTLGGLAGVKAMSSTLGAC